MRFLLFLVSILIALDSGLAYANDLASLAGTWNVTSVHTGVGTCNNSGTKGDVTSYIWIVSTNQSSGVVTVSVQGQTAFPSMSGFFSQGQLSVSGFKSKFDFYGQINQIPMSPISWFSLTPQPDGSLKGVRQYVGLQSVVMGDGTTTGYVTCFTIFEVTAKR